MIWALLAFVGVPLWLCAVGILALVHVGSLTGPYAATSERI